MNETYVTMRGNTTEDPRVRTTSKGEAMTTVRLASTPWRYDADSRSYVDGSTNFVTVVAFRQLATHIAGCVRKGDPIVVHGELQVSQWEQPDGRKGTNVEVRALSLGHDLARGTSTFTKGTQQEPRAPRTPWSTAAGGGTYTNDVTVIDPARAETDDYVVANA